MDTYKPSLRARLALYLAALSDWRGILGLDGPRRLGLRHNRYGGIYSGWIMLFAVAGTLCAVAVIAVTEGFVPSTLLVLTNGEYELLAVVFYIIAILLYLGEGKSPRRYSQS